MVRPLTRALRAISTLVVAGAAAAAGPPEDALVGEIPFHPDTPPSRVMIDLAPDGQRPFVLLLDTGASASVMTPGAARALGVTIRRMKDTAYRKATRLGRDLQFWVDTSLGDTRSRTGWDYSLLGADFLADYVVEIDYPGRFVRFYDPRRYAVPETATDPGERVIGFRRNGTRILTDLDVDGHVVAMLLDTGAPDVVLSGEAAEKADIAWQALPTLEGVSGVLGPIDAHTYVARRLRFAGFEFRDQAITIAPRGLYNQGGPTDSAIGFDVLSRFVLRIDYDNRRIWLKSDPKHVPTYHGTPQVSAVPQPAPPTPEEIAERDARRAARWKAERDARVYAETAPGRFVVVDGYRLRNGPKDGEVWYTHDEMLARKREVERGAGAH